MPRNQALYDAITTGNLKSTEQLLRAVVEARGDVVDLLNETMIPAMREVGDRFSRSEIFVPEMLIAARAMQAGLRLIEPLLVESGHKPRARVAVGTVKGDLHDIGKNLVVMMLKGGGFEVDDLGVDCSVDKYQAAVENGSRVICLSALLTTTMPYMKQVVAHFAGRDDVKIVIGGAPVTSEYARQIGAHGYGEDASDAVRAVESCL
jgi:5-methyltetrahydrofolate--homocysteine methyltransferase